MFFSLKAQHTLVSYTMSICKLSASAIGLVVLVVVLPSVGISASQPHDQNEHPPQLLNYSKMSTKQLVDEGEKIIFGGIGKSKARGAVGRGQCPLCHATQEGMLGERAPNLFGLPQRALARLKDPRYHFGKPNERDTVQKEAFPGSGTAVTALEYIAESNVCPSCYVVLGYGIRGTHDKESGGEPTVDPQFGLTMDELIAVITWLYVNSGKTPPTTEAIETAYKKFLLPSQWQRMVAPRSLSSPPLGLLATGEEPIFEIFRRGNCMNCHSIPGIGGHDYFGPELAMGTLAPQRIRDKSYKGTAKTAHEYVKESILNPATFVAEKYFGLPPMPPDYGTRLTATAVDKIVDYLMKLEEGKSPPPI